MTNILASFVLLALAIASSPVGAAAYQFQGSASPNPTAWSPEAVCTAYNTYYTACGGSISCISYPYGVCGASAAWISRTTLCSGTQAYAPGLSGRWEGSTWVPANCATTCPSNLPHKISDPVRGDYCSASPPCQSGQSGSYSFTGESLPSSGCLGGCGYSTSGVSVGIRVNGVMNWVATATSTGATCSGGNTMSATLPVTPTPDNCVVDSQGRTVCPGASSDCINVDGQEVCGPDGIDGKDCKMINGKVVCADATLGHAPENCIISADGKMRCLGDTTSVDTEVTSSTDPVTGNTTRTSVTTSGIAGSGTKTTTTVYGPDGSVISSSTTLTGGFDPGSTGTGGTGGSPDGSIEGTGEGEGEGEEEGEDLPGEGREFGEAEGVEVEWGRSWEDVRENLGSEWASAPVVEAVSSFQNLSLSAPSGTCPPLSFDFFGTTIATNVHCEFVQDVMPILSGLFIAIYGMTAIRIFLSA